MGERFSTSVNLERDHADWMDEENINRSEFINELITQYRENEGRMEEAIQKYRAEQLLEEANELENEGEQKKRKAERKREKAQEMLDASESVKEQTRVDLDEAREALEEANVPLDPSNPAVKTQAENVGLTPVELVEKLQEDGDAE